MIRLFCTTLIVALLTSTALGGTGYIVTSKQGDETITYEVKFGGGRRFEQHTAYDPVSESFAYLTWNRGAEAPKPAGVIWDHETGRSIKLYKFPNVEHPLPVIPSMDAMKVCPKTGDPDFKAKAILAYD